MRESEGMAGHRLLVTTCESLEQVLMMKPSSWLVQGFVLTLLLQMPLWGGEDPGQDQTEWKIKEIYQYLTTLGDELSQEDVDRYCQFIVDCQDPERGTFADKHDDYIYSVKAYHLLKRFGYEPRYRLAVIQQVGKDLHYGQVSDQSDVIVSDTIAPKLFRQWLDRVRDTYDAYAAGSLMGHFIAPHVMNLEQAGEPLEASPYIPVFQQWLLDNQGANGFWNRPDDTDFNGWNGVMKMDQALGDARITLPRQDRMLHTVLKHQDPNDANFTAAGGCTNHNALHTLRQWSKRNDLLMWREVFFAMERFANSAERRYDSVSGEFRSIPGFNNRPDFRATELVRMAVGNVIGYCRILLDPANQEKIENQLASSDTDEQVTPERIRKLLVQAVGLHTLATERIKAHVQSEREHRQ